MLIGQGHGHVALNRSRRALLEAIRKDFSSVRVQSELRPILHQGLLELLQLRGQFFG
jgi:hypothetical protein